MAKAIPFWARREFRWLLIALVMAVSILVVLIFEIGPILESRNEASDDPAALEAFLPKESGPGVAQGDPRLRELLAGVQDATPIENAGDAYRALVEHLGRTPDDALEKEAGEIPYGALLAHAPRLRGRAVALKVLFLKAEVIALDTKVGNVEFIYRAYVADLSGDEGYVVDCIRPVPAIEQRTLVRVNGLFFKVATYEGRRGPIEAPQLIGRELVVVTDQPKTNLLDPRMVYLGVAVLSLCLLLSVVFVVYRSRRPARPGLAPPRPRYTFVKSEDAARTPEEPRPRDPVQPVDRPAPPAPPAAEPARTTDGDSFDPAALLEEDSPPAAPPRHAARHRASPVRRPARVPAGKKYALIPIGLSFVLLLVLVGRLLYQAWITEEPQPLDLDAERAKAFAAAETAHRKILEIEEKVWVASVPPPPDAARAIGTLERELGKAAEKLQDLLWLLRDQRPEGWEEAEAEVGRDRLRIMLWILDARDVSQPAAAGTESEKEPSRSDGPGFFIPLNRAIGSAERAIAELAQVKEPGSPKAAELRAALEAVKGRLLKLEGYVKEGLTREDLTPEQLPELGTLREHLAKVIQAIERAERLAAPSPK